MNAQAPDIDAAKLVAEADLGGREPGGWPKRALLAVALAWSLFQLWIASPLPFVLGFGVLNDTVSRSVHLAFALFLAFLAYPALKGSPRDRIPLQDWALAAVAAFCGGYLAWFYAALAQRPGHPTAVDLATAIAGLALLLEAARRVLGLPMVVMAILFIAYIFGGPYMPDMIAHKGASLAKGMSHLWLTTEGVFGVALGVSNSFIFLFVLFGALLETAGAGNYFIKSAISLLGHLRGGPAKAAVVASATTGLISGSSIANVVTCGTFTIPLMKRVGYKPEKAGAIEAAAGVDGQIMPPVMGAAAFLMVEYVGIPYSQVMRHAVLPAVISYIALFYIVHIEAMKAGILGIPRATVRPWQQRLLSLGLNVSGFIVLAALVYYGLGWIKTLAGAAATPIVSLLMLAAYIGLVRFSARYPELALDDPNKPMAVLPEAGPTLRSGLHFLLPVAALIWNLMVEELSPGLSAFWATVFLMFILVTQRPLFAFFRGEPREGTVRRGFMDLFRGLVAGARNMVGIGVATAAAGIIVGTVTLTGVGLMMTELVEAVSGGNLMGMLLMVAVISLILGMGLPTTANYIVVSTLMAPVIVELGSQSGLLVPLIAVHMFVFYFGLMADVTPPVGLATYAAAGIARTDPIKTGIIGFGYSMRTAVLPFMFIFNTQLLLIGIDSVWSLLLTIASAVLANMMFAAGTQGWFLTRNRWYESAALLLVTFTLFRPGFWWDMVYPPFHRAAGAQLMQLAEAAPAGASQRVWVEGDTIEGKHVSKGVLLPLGDKAPARERLAKAGLRTLPSGNDLQVLGVQFGSRAEKLGLEQGFHITAVETEAPRPAKEWMFIPALLLLGVVAALQRARRDRTVEAPPQGSSPCPT